MDNQTTKGIINFIINFVFKNLSVQKQGRIISINSDGTYGVNFDLKDEDNNSVNAFNYPARQKRNIRQVLKIGDLVKVDFTDNLETMYLKYRQTKIIDTSLFHSLSNGIIDGPVLSYGEEDGALLSFDGNSAVLSSGGKTSVFTVNDEGITLKVNSLELKLTSASLLSLKNSTTSILQQTTLLINLLTSLLACLKGALVSYVSTYTPADPQTTESAKQAFTNSILNVEQIVQNLNIKINQLFHE